MEQNIYIKAEQCIQVKNKKIFIEDVVKIFGSDKKLVKELNGEVLYMVTDEKPRKYIFSILKVIELLQKEHPDLTINNVGETDFIVEYTPPTRKGKVLEILKVTFVCLSIFFGSAFTIMTFNEDVSVNDVFNLFYELVKEDPPMKGGIMQIAYSLGLPLGIIVFFNHFSKVKISSDPTPLQVQLRLYEEDVNKAIIENASREGEVKDV